MLERLYIHHPVSTGKGGYTKRGSVGRLHLEPRLQGGGGLEKGLQAPPPPRGFSIFPSPVLCVGVAMDGGVGVGLQ